MTTLGMGRLRVTIAHISTSIRQLFSLFVSKII